MLRRATARSESRTKHGVHETGDEVGVRRIGGHQPPVEHRARERDGCRVRVDAGGEFTSLDARRDRVDQPLTPAGVLQM
jgi:hypothetical protein